MSDLSEGENYYHPKRNVFDNDAKFEYDSKKETNISDMMPDKSVEYYSTTYTSNKNIKSGLDDDDDDGANHNNLMLTKKDETKMIHMRSFLSKVEKNFTDKHNIMQNIRY